MSDSHAHGSLSSSTVTFASPAAQHSGNESLTAQPLLTAPDAPAVDRLSVFQTAIGIPVTSPNPYSIYRKNRGIYASVTHGESYSRWAYHIFEVLIIVCLMLQILLAATLTALAASSASHIIITFFGAANTALAGTVALLKGQGLPNRLRQDWNGWRDLRDYIEEKEREIGCGKPGVNVWTEVGIIESKYDAVRKNQEKNRQDSYTHLPDKDSDEGKAGSPEDEKTGRSTRSNGKASLTF